MKKILFSFAIATTTVCMMACGSKNEQKAENSDEPATEVGQEVATEAQSDNKAAFPWDFPIGALKDAKAGQKALVPQHYPKLVEEGKDLNKTTINLFIDELAEIGDKTSTSKRWKGEYPNPLIIPLPEGQQAKVGDILLTANPTGAFSRAIVTDASDPAKPKVNFLDMSYSNDPAKPSFGDKFMNTQLEENTFAVINDGDLVPGAQVMRKEGTKFADYKRYVVLAVNGDRVLLRTHGAGITDAAKSDLVVIPFKEDIKVGDTVWALFAASYCNDYKVTKVDLKNGLVTVTSSRISNKEEVMPICDVTKTLQ